jgi:colanic acid/amylovoran biosynthesis glycosyltransferase
VSKTIFARDLLLDLGVPFRRHAGELFVEADAYNGLLGWLEHFPRITLCAPVYSDEQIDTSRSWVAIEGLLADDRLHVCPFPWGYGLTAHLTVAGQVRRALRTLIPTHRYLCFSNLGWLGAWGRIGAEEAYKTSRPYSLWVSDVLPDVPAIAMSKRLLQSVWHRIQHTMLKRVSLRDIRRCSLGLLHGRAVFDAFAADCRKPFMVHDVHLAQSDVISDESLEARLRSRSKQLRIVCSGRLHESTQPQRWLEIVQNVIEEAKGQRAVVAEWIGDGPRLDELRALVSTRGLAACVSLSGQETDRGTRLSRLREADLYVFCHLSSDSQPDLIEALMSGLPLVGFKSHYATDLLIDAAPAALSPSDDDLALSTAILNCVRKPEQLAAMSYAAREAGTRFADVAVFKQRSDLIKQWA